MTAIRLLAVATAIAIPLASTSPAHAVCGQGPANLSTADREFFAVHGCDIPFFTWEASSGGYDLHWGDWASRGWFDACNQQLEFPKHWSAALLVVRGLVDDYNRSFHATADYLALSRGPGSSFHDGFYHNVGDRLDAFGEYFHFLWDRAVSTFCPLYDVTVAPNANPASRAGDYMHEGWHAWLDKYGWDNGSCGGHRCTGCSDAGACDFFYFHGISVFEFGDLWTNDGTAARFHSPNQVQIEFMCDVADLQPHLPLSVRAAATADANRRATRRIINAPGYHCGDPRPW
jgi:hypothetical protein